MKTLALWTLIPLVLLAGPAAAQDPGDIGIFADAQGTLTTANPPAFAQSFLYIVAFDVPGNVNAWEANVGDLITNAGATILGVGGRPPLNVGDNASGNFIVGVGGCVAGTGPTVLATVTYIIFAAAPADTPICLRPSIPSSFQGDTPGYADCSSQIAPFGSAVSGGAAYPDGCLVLNPTSEPPVATESISFSQLKAGS